MTKQSTITRTELANRSSNGVEVTLIWGQHDGIDELVVCVSDTRAGAYFEIPGRAGPRARRLLPPVCLPRLQRPRLRRQPPRRVVR